MTALRHAETRPFQHVVRKGLVARDREGAGSIDRINADAGGADQEAATATRDACDETGEGVDKLEVGRISRAGFS